jgi:hypothetical protein
MYATTHEPGGDALLQLHQPEAAFLFFWAGCRGLFLVLFTGFHDRKLLAGNGRRPLDRVRYPDGPGRETKPAAKN